MMGTISANRAATLKKRIVQLAGEPALHFFELAQLLAELREADPAALAGLQSARGIRRRRMYYLLRAGELIREHHIQKQDAEKIGWTKLQIVARHVDNLETAPSSSTVSELLDIAKNQKARDLPAALRGRRVVPRRVVTFYLNLGARAELREALLQFGAKRAGKGLRGKEAALMRLVRGATGREPFG